MEPTLSIQDFNCMMHSAEAKSQLLQSLKEIADIEDPDVFKQILNDIYIQRWW